jgi:protein-S-isoprenylcysteine O-methyltransferase Ste14
VITARLLRWAAFTAILALVLFGGAGRLDLPGLWAYFSAWAAVMFFAVLAIDPELARERLRPAGPSADPAVLIGLRLLFVAHLLAGALDAGRLHGSDTVPTVARGAGLVGMTAALAWVAAAVAANRFFSPAVRIQSERGHQVVTAGPYRFVRHPGYAGMIVAAPCSGLALGSWLASAIGLLCAFLLLWRAGFEDRFLHQRLPGYGDYAGRVRYRLIPGVW